MAEKRYSRSDNEKRLQDFMADARAKGADFRECFPLHPEGVAGTLKDLKKDFSYTKDQSQAQTERNQENIKNMKVHKYPDE